MTVKILKIEQSNPHFDEKRKTMEEVTTNQS